MATRLLLTLLALGMSTAAAAQPLGAFRWQQQPYCNVFTLNVVQAGGVYQLDGTDDQCGAATKASVSGLAFPNPDGTIGMGLAIVTAPGGLPLHVDATITLAAIGGTWRDSTGATGSFVFTPGTPLAGAPRPVPKPAFPAGLTVGGGTITNLAAPVSDTDAANKAYVDQARTTVRQAMLNDRVWPAFVNANGTKGTTGNFTASQSSTGQYSILFNLEGQGVVDGDFFNYVVSPRCSGHTAIVGSRTVGSSGAFVTVHGTVVTITDAAGVVQNCSFFVMAAASDPNTGSPVPPLSVAASRPGAACSTEGEVTTCVETVQR